MPYYCIASNCTNTASYQFPKNPPLRKQWEEFVQATRKVPFDFHKYQHRDSQARLCRSHFETHCFKNYLYFTMGFSDRLYIKPNAVPTIHSEPKPKSSEASTGLHDQTNRRAVEEAVETQPPPITQPPQNSQLLSLIPAPLETASVDPKDSEERAPNYYVQRYRERLKATPAQWHQHRARQQQQQRRRRRERETEAEARKRREIAAVRKRKQREKLKASRLIVAEAPVGIVYKAEVIDSTGIARDIDIKIETKSDDEIVDDALQISNVSSLNFRVEKESHKQHTVPSACSQNGLSSYIINNQGIPTITPNNEGIPTITPNNEGIPTITPTNSIRVGLTKNPTKATGGHTAPDEFCYECKMCDYKTIQIRLIREHIRNHFRNPLLALRDQKCNKESGLITASPTGKTSYESIQTPVEYKCTSCGTINTVDKHS